jgi:hypothetical protein
MAPAAINQIVPIVIAFAAELILHLIDPLTRIYWQMTLKGASMNPEWRKKPDRSSRPVRFTAQHLIITPASSSAQVCMHQA